MDSENDSLCVATIRCLSADLPSAAKSGHPGAPMGMAPMAHLIFSKYMNVSPAQHEWINRDRFVLSNGHACALLYSMLHLLGYDDMGLDQLKNFRQLGSKTPGHPEVHETKGVEITTGPLGQGIANAVGLAMGERHMAAKYNRDGFELFNHNVFVFTGDGCLQEGVSGEASSLAGHLGLGNLIVLYDDNSITIDGDTSLSFSEDVGKRYESYGWQVLHVSDGNNLEEIDGAVKSALEDDARPSLICVKTVIGFGSAKQGTHGVHGSPLSPEDLANVKSKFGLDPEVTFHVPDAVKSRYAEVTSRGNEAASAWATLLEKYAESHPEAAAELSRRIRGDLPSGWEDVLPSAGPEVKADATRKISGRVLNALSPLLPDLMGGSADLNPSCFTYLKDDVDFQKDSPVGRNIRFGVREHGMAAILNGLAAYGGFIPFGSTFLNFIGYAQGAVTLSALSHLQVLYIFTHDSIGLGEDGPTHQPVEKYMMVRNTPNCLLFRPADTNETSGAYKAAIQAKSTPSVFSLTRQGVPNLAGSSIDGVLKGGYVLEESADAAVVLVGTGSETHLCVEAAKVLREKGVSVQVVSFPCFDLFGEQSDEYKAQVFPKGVPVLSVEAGTTLGWERYAHGSIGMHSFGASGKGAALFEHFGFTTDNVVAKAEALLAFYKDRPVPHLVEKPF